MGFHTPRLADSIDIVGDWAEKVGLDVGLARAMAESILVQPVDWVDEVIRVHEAGARWILDLGPGDILTRLTAPVIRGLGIGIVPAATRGGQRNLFTIGAVPEVARPWSSYAPSVVSLPDGQGQTLDEVHPADRPVTDPAGGDDPDHRRRQDRRRRSQRRALGRARRRRAGHRTDLQRPHRGAVRAA